MSSRDAQDLLFMMRLPVAAVTRDLFKTCQAAFVMQASRYAVWATCVMAMAITGCGGRPSRSGDAMQSGDAMPPDHPGADGGSDGPAIRPDGPAPCFVPTDCPAGLTCCVFLEGNEGVVFCQEKALCVGDGVSTFVVCATSADCPPAQPTCTPFGTAPNGEPFNLCGSP